MLHVLTFSLINRVRRTVHGSADDIGWLQRDPEMPSVEDGSERFTEILDSIRYLMLFNSYYCMLFHHRPMSALKGYTLLIDRSTLTGMAFTGCRIQWCTCWFQVSFINLFILNYTEQDQAYS